MGLIPPGDAKFIKEMLAEARNVSFDLECKDNLSEGLKSMTEKGVDVVLPDLMLPDSAGADEPLSAATVVGTAVCVSLQ